MYLLYKKTRPDVREDIALVLMRFPNNYILIRTKNNQGLLANDNGIFKP